jgi:hypothetical protein
MRFHCLAWLPFRWIAGSSPGKRLYYPNLDE